MQNQCSVLEQFFYHDLLCPLDSIRYFEKASASELIKSRVQITNTLRQPLINPPHP